MAIEQTLAVCAICGKLQRTPVLQTGFVARCRRCGEVLHYARKDVLAKVLWLVVAALILYIPANLYPILAITKVGLYSESTIWQGSVQLYQSGYVGVALLVFLASIVIPLFKLLSLLYLTLTHRSYKYRRFRTKLLAMLRHIGRWSMLDVFLVAILVALVKLGELATISPQPGLVAFAAVVVLTTYASAVFEPRLLWLNQEDKQDE